MKNDNLLFQIMFPAILLGFLLAVCSCTHYEEVKPGTAARYHKGDIVLLDGIKIPASRPPFTIDTAYYDKAYWEWAYDVHDNAGRPWTHLMQYQIKK